MQLAKISSNGRDVTFPIVHYRDLSAEYRLDTFKCTGFAEHGMFSLKDLGYYNSPHPLEKIPESSFREIGEAIGQTLNPTTVVSHFSCLLQCYIFLLYVLQWLWKLNPATAVHHFSCLLQCYIFLLYVLQWLWKLNPTTAVRHFSCLLQCYIFLLYVLYYFTESTPSVPLYTVVLCYDVRNIYSTEYRIYSMCTSHIWNLYFCSAISWFLMRLMWDRSQKATWMSTLLHF